MVYGKDWSEGMLPGNQSYEIEVRWGELSMTENSLLVKRERERELKKHQERILNMKPSIHSNSGVVRDSLIPLDSTKQQQPLIRARIDKDKLRQIEKQNYRLLMRLRYIHKNYSLYMPKKHVYLQRGEAGWVKKLAKKPAKAEETSTQSTTSAEIPKPHNRLVAEEMANRVAAVNLWKT